MVLSKREQLIAILTTAILVLLVLDRYALTPFFRMREETRSEKEQLQAELAKGKSLLGRRERLRQTWRELVAGGLQRDASETESRVLHEVRKWSGQYGLTLSSIKPDHVGGGDNLHVITFLVTGTGSMSTVGQFLYAVETTSLPLRVKTIQLGSRREGVDEMSLQVGLSAIHLSAETEGASSESGDTPTGDRS